ncbi:MAG: patatin-like phospholipase family protein [Candidatus Melainabacteria bacterium]|nr:patatin-like phospholipase family protein [Candidatus Melainabacteria bacterium]
MIDYTNSVRNIVSAFRGHHHALEIPKNKIALLRKPWLYKAGIEPLENSHLEKSIASNIINKNDDTPQARFDAFDFRALYKSLSEDGKKKFSKIQQAFYIATTQDRNHKENKKMLEEISVIIQGGEIRVVASTATKALLKVLLDSLGVKPKHFYGVSAGGFQAAGMAFKAPNFMTIAHTADTDYYKITKTRRHLKEWINNLMKDAYCFTTGKKEHEIEKGIIRGKHLEEVGTNLQVLVGEVTKWFPPHMESYFLPKELKGRFGIDLRNFELATALAASANLWGLFFFIDPTFGRCSIRDFKGLNHYQLDPGLDRVNGIPLNDFETGIKEYIEDKRKLPPFALILGNKRINSLEQEIIDKFADFIDSFSMDPLRKVKKLGAERLHIQSFCAVEDPFIKGNTAMLRTGNLKISVHDKEVLISANIPTSDFTNLRFQGEDLKPALDQLYENFVDEEYIKSNGEKGKSPFQLYIDDVNKIKFQHIDEATFKARLPGKTDL